MVIASPLVASLTTRLAKAGPQVAAIPHQPRPAPAEVLALAPNRQAGQGTFAAKVAWPEASRQTGCQRSGVAFPVTGKWG